MGLIYYLGLAMLAVTCLCAWFKGGRPERSGAVLYASAWAGFDLTIAISRSLGVSSSANFTILLNLTSDMVVAVGLLIIALRYMSLWLGAAMWVQSLCFVVHSLMLDGDSAGQRVYLAITNVLSFAVLACLLTGTLASWRRRVSTVRRVAFQPTPLAEHGPAQTLSPAA